MAALHIELLGGFSARTECGKTVAFATRKAQALLAYLALSPGRAHARASLYGLLWGDREEEQARGSLRYALTDIRKGLGERHGVLCTERDVVSLKAGAVVVDAVEFERLARSDDSAVLRQAASLYTGDLLEGIETRASGFDEWLALQRERLRSLAIRVLGRLLDSEPDPDVAHRLLALDPLSEAAHRALMRHYAEHGQRPLAIRQFETCAAALKREVGAQPEPATLRLRDSILQRQGAEDHIPQAARDKDLTAGRPTVRVAHITPIGQLGEAANLPEGLCNSIATELARFRDIRVFRTGGSDAAQFVLDGTVQCLGRLRVTVRLLEQQTGQQIWAERYDHSTEDLFTTQDELAARVATTVAARLTTLVRERAQHRAPHDLRAYECLVEGNRYVDRLDSPEAQEQARSWFERALQIEPTFARAHTGLAFVSAMRSFLTDIGKPAAEHLDIALYHAETALDLDPTDPRVHYTLAYICLQRREFERSERHFLRAVELNPNDPTILIMWGYAQACVGHAEAGLRTLESALRYMLSPPHWYFSYRARVLVLARRPGESAEQFAGLSQVDGPRNLGWQVVALAHDEQVEEACLIGKRFVEATRCAWRGDASAGPREFVSWFLNITPIARSEDREYLRVGLTAAGLPT